MSKFVLLTICLIVSSAFARYDFVRHQHGHRATVGDNADLIAFAKGFLKGVGEDSVFDQVKACLGDGSKFYKDVTTAIADIKTKNPAKVKEGIILLGQAVQLLPQAARDCKAAEADIAKLIKLARAFSNPIAFAYTVGKSLLINHVEIIHEITSAVKAYDAHDYFTLGYWVGKAMDTIFLGLNRKVNEGLIEHINNNDFGWTAGVAPKFANMTLAEIKAQFLGAPVPEGKYEGVPTLEADSNDVPDHFDSSEKWPGCIHPIRDQGHCGSCWAFAASEVLSDRFCIASDKKTNVVLSPQDLVSCDTSNYGCNGGYPVLSWRFLVNKGIVSDSCWPYSSGGGVAPKCNTFTACHDGSAIKKYKAAKLAQFGSISAIQKNIMEHGPVEAAFSVYEDFIAYKGGIYKHTSGSLLGGHAVKIIGWGKEGSTNYWIVANSWNTTWGEKGFFRIAFGQVGIDKACLAGEAHLDNQEPHFLWGEI